MKKTIAIIASIALACTLAFSLTSCKNDKKGDNKEAVAEKTPATEFIDKMEAIIKPNIDIIKNDIEPEGKQKEKIEKQMKELQAFLEENKDYELTDGDRKAFKSFMLDMSKKMGEELPDNAEELLDVMLKQFKTLGDLSDNMDFMDF